MKTPFVVYASMEFLLEKKHTCENNPGKSFTTKINKRTACGYSISTQSSFDSKKSEHGYCRGEDTMKKFCRDPCYESN